MRRVAATTRAARGFTIVELMMATLVFSLILLLVTIGILQVNRIYYRGVTEANTQNVARSIMDVIAQAIQFNGGTIAPPTNPAPTAGTQYYVCVSNLQFVYRPGYQLVSSGAGPNQTTQAFIQRSMSGSCAAPPTPLIGRELLTPKMRLSNLQITQVGTSNLYRVHVTVAYGDDSVLNNPTALLPTCKSIRAGNQFCAVSDLTTVVEKRLN